MSRNDLVAIMAAILMTRPEMQDAMSQIASAINVAESILSAVEARSRRNEKLPRPAQVPTDIVEDV